MLGFVRRGGGRLSLALLCDGVEQLGGLEGMPRHGVVRQARRKVIVAPSRAIFAVRVLSDGSSRGPNGRLFHGSRESLREHTQHLDHGSLFFIRERAVRIKSLWIIGHAD